MIIGSAEVLIEPTSRGFAQSLEADLTPGVTSVAKKLGGIVAAAISVREVGQFFKSTVDEASNAEEAASKVGVVFGEASENVIDFAANSADAFGQSNNQALEATGTFGNLFRALELTEQQSGSMATTLTGLASDLASFNNVEVDEALTALRSGLVGETEPLKRFGVNLNEARIRQEALNMGLEVGTGVLDANVKAQAAYSLILQDTALAQGDFERTSEGLANQQRIATAEWANAKTEIGQGLLPVAKELIAAGRDDLIPMVVDLATSAVPLLIAGFETAEPLMGTTTTILQAMAPALEVVADVINAIPDPLIEAGTYALVASKGLGLATTAAGGLASGMESLRGNMGRLTRQAGAFAVAGIAVERTLNAWSNEMSEANDDASALARTLIGDFDPSKASMDEMHEELIRLNGDIAELDAHHDEAVNPFLRARYAETSDQLMVARDALLETEAAAAELQAELGISSDEALRMATNSDIMAAATEASVDGIDAQAAAAEADRQQLEELEASIRGVVDANRAAIDPFFAVQDALVGHHDAQQDVTDAEWAVIEAMLERDRVVREHGQSSDEAREANEQLTTAQRDLDDANRDVWRSAGDVSAATYELARQMQEGGLSIEGAEAQLRNWVGQGLLTEQQAREAAIELGLVGVAARDLEGRNITIPVGMDKSDFDAKYNSLSRQLAGLSGVEITTLIERDQALAGRGSVHGAADGFSGTVSRPTMFMTGEGGEPEDVLVVPQSLGGVSRVVAELAAALGGGGADRFGRTGVNQTNHIIINESNDGRSAAMQVVKRLRGAGFRGGLSGVLG